MFLRLWREILIIILAIASFSSMRSCSNKNDTISLLESARDSAYNVATIYYNKYGESISQIKTHEITEKELRDNLDVLGVDNKKLKEQIGSTRNLVAYWKGKAHKSDTIQLVNHDTIVVENGGSVKAKWFTYQNKWLQLDGVSTPTTTTIAYSYMVDFQLTTYYKSQGLFKKKVLVTDFTFSDPSVIVGQFKGIVIKQPPKKWFETRGFAVGVGFIGALILTR